jgi:DtxR family Mn-dependent transcriptional regulator
MEHNNTTSEREQMYLVTIARLSEMVDECPIPISKVAEILDITPISANQMVHNLAEMDLLTYKPYKGVEFTEKGWQTAEKLLRIRRLWEVFLVEHLQYAPQDAGPLACRLEHAIPDEAADRLAVFLGCPEVSPKGKPIPYNNMDETKPPGVLLSKLSAGTTGKISVILMGEGERAFLQQSGMNIGSQVEILASQKDGAYLVKSGDHSPIHIARELAQKIRVKVNT